MAGLASLAAARHALRLAAVLPSVPPYTASIATIWTATTTTTTSFSAFSQLPEPHPRPHPLQQPPHAPLHTPLNAPLHSLLTAATFATASRFPPPKNPPATRRGPPGKPGPGGRPTPSPPVQRRPFNLQITAPEVRVVLPSGETRVMETREALRLAREHNTDLVEMSSSQVPPVCRVMDYRKYLDDSRAKAEAAAQEAAERAAAEARVPQKEVQFSVRIADHDMEIKLKKVLEFLHDGRKVLLVVKFRGAGEQRAADQALDYLLATIRQRATITASAVSKGQHGLNCTVRLAAGPS